MFVMTLAIFNSFWHLSSSAIADSDEARYGVAASEMLHNHAALVATYAGEPEYWNLKPPLGYWMQECSYYFFGQTVFAMRLPSALCAIGVIALTMSLCRRWYGRRAALLAGLIVATCFGFFSNHGARSGDLDAALTLIMLVAVMQIPQLGRSAPHRLMWAGAIALGFLLKSFAVLPFVAMTVLYLLWSGDWRRSCWSGWVPPVTLLSSVIIAWVLARFWADGSMYFVIRMLREDLVERSTRVVDVSTYAPWGYTTALFDRFAPWPLVILIAALAALKGSLAALLGRSRLVLLWAVVPLVLFSAARTQHHWYLDPTYPALSMLAATAGLNLMTLPAQRGRMAIAGLLVLGVVACEARLLWRIGIIDRSPQNQSFLIAMRDHALIPADETIHAGFPLSHSERFILQVVDGYKVVDSALPLSSILPAEHGLLLLRRGQVKARFDRYSTTQYVAMSEDYVVVEATAQTANALPAPRGISQATAWPGEAIGR